MKVIDIEKKLSRVPKRLGEILIEAGLIDEKTLGDALEVQKIQNKRLGDVLIEMEVVNDVHIADVLAKQLGSQFHRIDKIKIDAKPISLITGELARKHLLVPLQEIDKKLVVAMSNPLDLNAVEDIQFATGKTIYVVVSPLGDIQNAIETYYPRIDVKEAEVPASGQTASVEVLSSIKADEEAERSDEELTSLADLPPVVRFTNAIIADGIKSRASDIHIEPQTDKNKKSNLIVRCRIDGIMHEILRTDRHVHPSLVSRIKIISGLDISERRKPQDGKAQVRYSNEKYDLRVSSIPTTYGEKITIRILNPSTAKMDPSDLGFSERDLASVHPIVA